MGKYEPLGQFLRQQEASYVAMTFADIERVLGSKLPPSSKDHRAWWSNNPSNNVMTRQWLDAGYETESVDLAAEKLVFRKIGREKASRGGPSDPSPRGADGSKYEALGQFLRQQTQERIPMSFEEIEKIVGTKLPESKKYPAWWSNNTSNNTMTRQWLDAGYQTESVNVDSEKLIFRKVRKLAASISQDAADKELVDHPIWGCMAGTITVMPGVDLTEPMEFEWGGKLYNE